MADSFDLNNQSRAADAAPQIPTSSSEVAVRTMTSDVGLMGQSGGMVSQSSFEGTQVPVTLSPEFQRKEFVPIDGPAPASNFSRIILITGVIILGMIGLFALGYFVIGN